MKSVFGTKSVFCTKPIFVQKPLWYNFVFYTKQFYNKIFVFGTKSVFIRNQFLFEIRSGTKTVLVRKPFNSAILGSGCHGKKASNTAGEDFFFVIFSVFIFWHACNYTIKVQSFGLKFGLSIFLGFSRKGTKAGVVFM